MYILTPKGHTMKLLKEDIKTEREALRARLQKFLDETLETKSSAARQMDMSYQHIINFINKDNYKMGQLGLKKIKNFLNNKDKHEEL